MSEHPPRPAMRHPGTDGIWTFVFIDMIVFLLLFTVFLEEKLRLPAVFAAGQAQLNVVFGLVNALLLLTSSMFMAEAVHSARAGKGSQTRLKLRLAMLLGALFIGNKLFEFAEKLSSGHTPASSVFFSFYFIVTGMHFLHVLGGMIFIGHCQARAVQDVSQLDYVLKLENVGLFWHFVDLLWLFIFPLIYLAGLK